MKQEVERILETKPNVLRALNIPYFMKILIKYPLKAKRSPYSYDFPNLQQNIQIQLVRGSSIKIDIFLLLFI